MVVIIADPILVKRRRTSRLNAPYQPLLNQHCERVVDRLLRDGPDPCTHFLGNRVHRPVRLIRNRPQYREALRRYRDRVLAEQVCKIHRASELKEVLDSIKNLFLSNVLAVGFTPTEFRPAL